METKTDMTREKMYNLLTEKYNKTDWDDYASIKEYNEYARMLRQLLYETEDEE